MQENQRMSRKPSKSTQITAPSIDELHRGLVHGLAPELSARGVQFRGRKLRPGPVLNAIVLHFLSMPIDEQERITREYLARYERLLESDEPVKLAEVVAPRREVAQGVPVAGPAPPSRGRKRA